MSLSSSKPITLAGYVLILGGHPELVGSVDDVEVGHYVPVTVPNDAGPCPRWASTALRGTRPSFAACW